VTNSDAFYQYWGWALDQVDAEDRNVPSSETWADSGDIPMNAQLNALLNSVLEIGWGSDDYADNANMDQDLPLVEIGGYTDLGNGRGETLYHLKEGIERFMITDINNPAASAMAQSEIPVMWDGIVGSVRPDGTLRDDIEEFHHIPGGVNAVYMDGHVEWVAYPGRYPATTVMAAIARGY